VAAQQILKNTSATLQQTFSAGAADGTVTVTITRADGTSLASGNATHGAGGIYTYALTPQAELDRLTVTWSGAWGGVTQSIVGQAEIVAGQLFSIADARAFGDQVLNDNTKYPDATIREARERITDLFQQCCSVSFVPRYARDILDGPSGTSVLLENRRPRRIISGSIDGTALTAGDITNIALYPTGQAAWITGSGWRSWKRAGIVVSYEHGYASPPADIQRAALTLCRYELVSNDISDRMIAFTNDLGTIRMSVPGRNYPTGLPLVDGTLARYDECLLIA
jgi:hypothetical protein